MTRILKTMLNFCEGQLYLGDELFSGLAFSISEDGHVTGESVDHGKVTSLYSPITASRYELPPQVCLEAGTGQDDEIIVDGQPFSGVGYEFSGGKCIYEVLVINGFIDGEVRWDESGNLWLYSVQKDGYSQHFEWYPGGILKLIRIKKDGEYSGSLSFSEKCKLKNIASNDGFLGEFPALYQACCYFTFFSADELLSLEFDND